MKELLVDKSVPAPYIAIQPEILLCECVDTLLVGGMFSKVPVALTNNACCAS